VRRGTLASARATPGVAEEIAVAEVRMMVTPVQVTGLPEVIRWWRDAKGHLVRVGWGERSRVLRDDPPT
jgi:hypothetical protein